MQDTNRLTELIIGAAIDVHRALGPGLLESSYQMALCHELAIRGIEFKSQIEQPALYKGVRLDCGYRIDLLVENQTIVELKAVDAILPIHEAQLLTYLRLSNLQVGLLINFHVPILKNGIRRLVNQFSDA